HFAALLEMALPFATALPLVLLRRYQGAPRLPGIAVAQVVAAALSALCILLAIVYSLSRMALCGALVSLAMLILLGRHTGIGRRTWIAAGSIVAAIGILTFVIIPPVQTVARFAKTASHPGSLIVDRFPIWEETVRLAADYPVFGCGLGAREFAYLRYKTAFPLYTSDFAHNDFLQLFAELGAVGFLLAAALGVAVMWTAWRAARGQTEMRVRYMAFAALAAMVALFLHSFVDFNLYIPANALLLAWIAGISCGLRGGAPV
ncbi:MAG: O-antigen ligase family protein, partial [Bryobacteraceae bacterium]